MNERTHIEDELLINYLLGETTAAENQAVENWLAEDASNQAHYDEFKKVWEQSLFLADNIDVDEEAAWKRLQVRMKKGRGFSVYRSVAAIAAMLIIALGIFWMFNQFENSSNSKTQLVKVHTISSSLESLIDTLSDQSIITLNKKAELTTPEQFVAQERRVKLEGEAFFDIAPNKEKPFIIETISDVEIKVVGTSFNVKSFDEYTEVIVETGIVELNRAGQSIRLLPNEKARIYKNDKIMKVEKSTDKLYQYYRSRKFVCDNTPLSKVVEVLNEAYDEKIIIREESLKNLPLTTRFDNEPLDLVLEVLSETFEFDVIKKGNTYIIL
jgi:ferric-dicitrate binding protein FerR (iron transport regulator)